MDDKSNPPTLNAAQELELFDEILRTHVTRLVGSAFAVDGLPLHAVAIACVALLAAREREIHDAPAHPPERYQHATLSQALAELGLLHERVETTLGALTAQGYLTVEPQGALVAQKRAMSMTLLLDRLFPRMPGLQLVLYVLQTMEEVISGRKDLAFALQQWDQILQKYGVALPQAVLPQEAKRPPTDHPLQAVTLQALPKQKELSRQEALDLLKAQIQSQRPDKVVSATESVTVWDITALSPRDDHGWQDHDSLPEQTDEVFHPNDSAAIAPMPPETHQIEAASGVEVWSEHQAAAHHTADAAWPEVSHKDDAVTESETTPGVAGPNLESAGLEPGPSTVSPSGHDGAAAPASLEAALTGNMSSDRLDDARESASAPTFTEASLPSEACAHLEDVVEPQQAAASALATAPATAVRAEAAQSAWDDEEVESQIEAFEEELAMACPMCTTGRIRQERTKKGQLFYSCSTETCKLMSWGRPYHQACPMCHNPFLVEIVDRTGTTSLKCPRATCFYNKRLHEDTDSRLSSQEPTPTVALPRRRRRVVRRRVARRK